MDVHCWKTIPHWSKNPQSPWFQVSSKRLRVHGQGILVGAVVNEGGGAGTGGVAAVVDEAHREEINETLLTQKIDLPACGYCLYGLGDAVHAVQVNPLTGYGVVQIVSTGSMLARSFCYNICWQNDAEHKHET